jgi:hypothetical protein
MERLPIYQNYKFNYSVYLDDTDYDLEFSWSVANKTFLLSMYKKDGTCIFFKTALVPGIDFLKVSGIGELGALTLLDVQNESAQDPELIEDFQTRYQLIYASNEEVNYAAF